MINLNYVDKKAIKTMCKPFIISGTVMSAGIGSMLFINALPLITSGYIVAGGAKLGLALMCGNLSAILFEDIEIKVKIGESDENDSGK